MSQVYNRPCKGGHLPRRFDRFRPGQFFADSFILAACSALNRSTSAGATVGMMCANMPGDGASGGGC
jgi:hypothetical protein